MKALIVGCGNIGSVAAEDLANSMSSIEVVIADKDEKRAKTVADGIGKSNVSHRTIDVTNRKTLVHTLSDFDVILGFLPGKLGYQLIEACIEAERDLVDVSFMAENPLELSNNAVKAAVTIVPDCGLAPGISNLLVGQAAASLDEVCDVHIMVGGLPEKDVPPLGYVITWSPDSLIDEYTRKARIVRKGKIVDVEVLSGLETIGFPGFGKLEAFFTDGLRTLMYTIRSTGDMWEKTLRYSGHAEKIKLLKMLGFFEDTQVQVDGTAVSPRKLTAKLLGKKLTNPEMHDIVALKVEVSGIANGKKTRRVYHLLDECDRKRGITAMARTTAYPASIVAQLMLKKLVKEKGVVPPEKLGMDAKIAKAFLSDLAKRGVHVNCRKMSD